MPLCDFHNQSRQQKEQHVAAGVSFPFFHQNLRSWCPYRRIYHSIDQFNHQIRQILGDGFQNLLYTKVTSNKLTDWNYTKVMLWDFVIMFKSRVEGLLFSCRYVLCFVIVKRVELSVSEFNNGYLIYSFIILIYFATCVGKRYVAFLGEVSKCICISLPPHSKTNCNCTKFSKLWVWVQLCLIKQNGTFPLFVAHSQCFHFLIF